MIRACTEEDLVALERYIPTGENGYHAQRFERQQAGVSTYLIAWRDGVPVGHAELRWSGCSAAEVQQAFPGCPELNGLAVWPESLRGQGIGTALIAAVEDLCRDRGTGRIGLGVADGNDTAAGLYLRLGYAETGCRYRDRYTAVEGGVVHQVADPCRFLVKEL